MRHARACPTHGAVLDDLEDGALWCRADVPHQVTAWTVVDVVTGEVVGAGRTDIPGGRPAGVWLGPRLGTFSTKVPA